ncbi:MAG: hypothetical protein WCK34_18100, partial [Bacteroidota bacterium]
MTINDENKYKKTAGLHVSGILTFFFVIHFSAINGQELQTGNMVNVIQAPSGSLVPDVFMDNNGVLHMVYAKNQNCYYIRSTDNGATFSSPVKINSSGSVEFSMGERGPK